LQTKQPKSSLNNREVNIKECNSCGKCCVKYSNGQLSASADEIEYWDVFRPEIAEYVSDGKIWMSPETSKLIELCPWLKKAPDSTVYTCDIYYDRPEDCRFYPVTITEMIRDECEMLEDRDLVKQKQAQRDLDKIMADSR
jgi:Fe-S-cluster containining protein